LVDGNLWSQTAGDLSPQGWSQKLAADLVYRAAVRAAEKFMTVAGTLKQTEEERKPFKEQEVLKVLKPEVTIDRKFEVLTLGEVQGSTGRAAKKNFHTPCIAHYEEGTMNPTEYFVFALPTERHPVRTMTIATKLTMGQYTIFMARIDHVVADKGNDVMREEIGEMLGELKMQPEVVQSLMNKKLKTLDDIIDKHRKPIEGEEEDGEADASIAGGRKQKVPTPARASLERASRNMAAGQMMFSSGASAAGSLLTAATRTTTGGGKGKKGLKQWLVSDDHSDESGDDDGIGTKVTARLPKKGEKQKGNGNDDGNSDVANLEDLVEEDLDDAQTPATEVKKYWLNGLTARKEMAGKKKWGREEAHMKAASARLRNAGYELDADELDNRHELCGVAKQITRDTLPEMVQGEKQDLLTKLYDFKVEDYPNSVVELVQKYHLREFKAKEGEGWMLKVEIFKSMRAWAVVSGNILWNPAKPIFAHATCMVLDMRIRVFHGLMIDGELVTLVEGGAPQQTALVNFLETATTVFDADAESGHVATTKEYLAGILRLLGCVHVLAQPKNNWRKALQHADDFVKLVNARTAKVPAEQRRMVWKHPSKNVSKAIERSDFYKPKALEFLGKVQQLKAKEAEIDEIDSFTQDFSQGEGQGTEVLRIVDTFSIVVVAFGKEAVADMATSVRTHIISQAEFARDVEWEYIDESEEEKTRLKDLADAKEFLVKAMPVFPLEKTLETLRDEIESKIRSATLKGSGAALTELLETVVKEEPGKDVLEKSARMRDFAAELTACDDSGVTQETLAKSLDIITALGSTLGATDEGSEKWDTAQQTIEALHLIMPEAGEKAAAVKNFNVAKTGYIFRRAVKDFETLGEHPEGKIAHKDFDSITNNLQTAKDSVKKALETKTGETVSDKLTAVLSPAVAAADTLLTETGKKFIEGKRSLVDGHFAKLAPLAASGLSDIKEEWEKGLRKGASYVATAKHAKEKKMVEIDDGATDTLRQATEAALTEYKNACTKFKDAPADYDSFSETVTKSCARAQATIYNALLIVAVDERGADKAELQNVVEGIFSDMQNDKPVVPKSALHPAVLKRANDAAKGV
jgi:hypothetical protein